MENWRFLKSWRVVRRRFAVVVGLAAVTLGLVVVPSASAVGPAEQTVAPLTVTNVPVLRIPVSGRFIPPKVGTGNNDFEGHGPDIVATATLNVIDSGRRLAIVLCMRAKATPGDLTEVNGCSVPFLIFVAPVGECVRNVSVGTFDEIRYTDDDHADDVLPSVIPNTFVSVWNIVGDTNGNEAGTKTGVSIGTNGFSVTTLPC